MNFIIYLKKLIDQPQSSTDTHTISVNVNKDRIEQNRDELELRNNVKDNINDKRNELEGTVSRQTVIVLITIIIHHPMFGDFNTSVSRKCLAEFCNLNGLTSFIKKQTCFKNTDKPI